MKEDKKGTVARFFKKNGYYMLLGVCVVAIALMVTFAILAANKKPLDVENPPIDTEIPGGNDGDDGNDAEKPDDGNQPDVPVDKPVTFRMPLESCVILKDYTENGVEYNQTLGRYEGHMGIDFGGEENAAVFAVYDGTIESVTTGYLEGTKIVIDHGNNLKTVYTSLANGDLVTEGQTVKAGDKIGEISTTNSQEYKDGAHLHFECFENGERINPNKYLLLEEK